MLIGTLMGWSASIRCGKGLVLPCMKWAKRLRGLIQRWYSTRLVTVQNSGSFAKGTSIRGGVDLDLFISLRPRTGKSLRTIYNGLYRYADEQGLRPRRQNVSIGVQVDNVKVDLVPARKHSGTDYHSLYRNRHDGWIKTNVAQHIRIVRGSGRATTIRAAKVWRTNRGIRLPSFYLELAVLRALRQQGKHGTAEEFRLVLEFLAKEFVDAEFVDPANDQNVISDDLTLRQKREVADQAHASLQKIRDGAWERVLW